MSENIELHGGPRHGANLAIPANYGNRLDFEILVRVGDQMGRRHGHYTRVHTISDKPLHEFEWAGFTTPFEALQEGAQGQPGQVPSP